MKSALIYKKIKSEETTKQQSQKKSFLTMMKFKM